MTLLRTLIAAETGLDPAELGEDDPFERHGIDSLTITKLNRELDKRFDRLSKTLFFEYATLGELAGYFAEHHGAELRGTAGPGRPAGPPRRRRPPPRSPRRRAPPAPPARAVPLVRPAPHPATGPTRPNRPARTTPSRSSASRAATPWRTTSRSSGPT
ncbi:acyl carrier protein [Streptomyces sp. DHE7-1]|nr:acyl carrier protein [Streptomyces sp. DHE7-1]